MVPENIDIANLLQVAVKAGDVICQIYKKDFTIEYKDDKSPLTEADMESNKVITEVLEKKYPEIPILSEESKTIEYETRKSWDFFWLIDPLDGTKEFIKKNGEFTVNIALINNGNPILGVVYVPVKQILYFGHETLGAYIITEKNSELNACKSEADIKQIATKLPVKSDENLPYTIVGSRSHMSDETKEYIEKKEKEHGNVNVISSGSSIKLCMVAEGKADVYPRFAPTMEWDTAAGHAVAKMSGAEVINAETQKNLTYNKQNLKNPWFIVQRCE